MPFKSFANAAPGSHEACLAPRELGAAVGLARQPIYFADQTVFGYELLYRDFGGEVSGLQKTSSLLHTVFLDMSISAIAGDHQIFVNFDAECLTAGLTESLPPERCVIELLETVPVDEDVLEAVADLRQRGFRIALDDWRPDDHRAELLESASFVKLDWPLFSRSQLTETVRELRRPGLELLAEKIERDDEFAFARSLGIDLFQGYLFARPLRIEGRRIPVWIRICVQLMKLTSGDEFDVGCCVKLIEQDPMLCQKLLKFTNSASMGLRQEVQSIRMAVSYLGRKGVRRLVSQVLGVGTSQRPAPEMTQVLLHAKFSEILSQQAGADADAGFLAGLLRGLHENLDLPLPQLLQDLAVGPVLREALLSGCGLLGDVLQTVAQYDVSEGPAPAASHAKLTLPGVSQAFLNACQWTDELLSSAGQ